MISLKIQLKPIQNKNAPLAEKTSNLFLMGTVCRSGIRRLGPSERPDIPAVGSSYYKVFSILPP